MKNILCVVSLILGAAFGTVADADEETCQGLIGPENIEGCVLQTILSDADDEKHLPPSSLVLVTTGGGHFLWNVTVSGML